MKNHIIISLLILSVGVSKNNNSNSDYKLPHYLQPNSIKENNLYINFHIISTVNQSIEQSLPYYGIKEIKRIEKIMVKEFDEVVVNKMDTLGYLINTESQFIESGYHKGSFETSEYIFDSGGNKITIWNKVRGEKHSKVVISFNENSIEKKSHFKSGRGSTTIFYFDDNGKLIKKETKLDTGFPDFDILNEFNFVYDKNNLIVEILNYPMEKQVITHLFNETTHLVKFFDGLQKENYELEYFEGLLRKLEVYDINNTIKSIYDYNYTFR